MADNQASRAKFQSPGHYTKKDREKINEADFAGPDRSFPILTQQDVHDAARLIGHAADPEAVKRRVIAIAKRKGFSLPATWTEQEEKERAAAIEEARAGGVDYVENVYTAPITRIDPEKRLVTVTATSESVDSFGTVFDYEASKRAFQKWVGNIREMHAPKAVGTRVAVHCDDERRKIDVTLRISKGAQDTWEKVLDGTLKGASIGASDVMWERPTSRSGERVHPRAVDYRLVELSLVDNPSNPDCLNIGVVRNAVPDERLLDLVSRAAAESEEMDDDMDYDRDEDAGEGDEEEMAAAAPKKGKASKRAAAAKHPDGRTAPATTPHDPIASTGDGDADHDPADALFDAAPEGGAEELDTDLRPVKLEGAAAVDPGSEYDEKMTEYGGPPADATGSTFAATRPQGVLGSEVRGETQGEESSEAAPAGGQRMLSRDEVFARAGGSTATATQAPAQAPTPQLAPFGYGATQSPMTHALTATRAAQAAARNAALRREDEVRLAGDNAERAAIAQQGEWSPASGLDYPAWHKRIAEARGRAEREVMERHRAEDFAAQAAAAGVDPLQAAQSQRHAARPGPWQAPHHPDSQAAVASARQLGSVQQQQQRVQTGLQPTAATSIRTQLADAAIGRAQTPVAAPVSPVAPVVEGRAAEPEQALVATQPAAAPVAAEEPRADLNSAMVQTAPVASSPASEKALMGSGRQAHSHNHGHNGALVHGADGGHVHTHTHLDGTTHAHAHLHAHDHHDHHGEMRAAGMGGMDDGMTAGLDDHSHEHQHAHDHSHSYRAGQPTDAALLLAEVQRAGANNTQVGHPPSVSALTRKPMNVERPSAPVAPSSLQPVSGSAQSYAEGAPQSPQMNVHPAAVGNLDLINTEDANAVGFGVPAEATPIPTPADGQVTAPAGFHEGGHTGDMHAAPLSPANHDMVADLAPMGTDEIPHGASAGQGMMDDDLDHDAEEDAREREVALAGGRSTAEAEELRSDAGAEEGDPSTATATATLGAEETRVGARISSESRATLHAVRDSTEANMRALCAHCGCDECTGKLDALAHAAEAHANPERVAAAGGSDPVTLFAQQRVLQAMVQRAVTEALEATLSAALAPVAERLTDFELSLAESATQSATLRGAMPAQVTRAMTELVQTQVTEAVTRVVAPLAEHVSQLGQFGQQLEQIAEAASGSQEAVARIEERVERIASQPASIVAPYQNAGTAIKRLATEPSVLASGGLSQVERDEAIAALQEQARNTRDAAKQTRLASIVMQLQSNGGQNGQRALIGQ